MYISVNSVQFSHSVVSDSLWPHGLQHARPHSASPAPGVHSNPCPSSRWCHPTISSSVVPFSSCPQSFPASGSFPKSNLFHYYVLLQDIEYSFLCYTVGPCCLSILYISQCVSVNPKLLSLPTPVIWFLIMALFNRIPEIIAITSSYEPIQVAPAHPWLVALENKRTHTPWGPGMKACQLLSGPALCLTSHWLTPCFTFFIYLFLVARSLLLPVGCVWFGWAGLLFLEVLGFLTAAAPLASEHRL